MFSPLLVQHLGAGQPAAEHLERGLGVDAVRLQERRRPRRAAGCSPATISWFAALTVWPAPFGPTWTTVLPTASRTGRAASKSSAVPPTMIDSAAFFAPASPPETGASSRRKPALLGLLGELGGDVRPDAGEVDHQRARLRRARTPRPSPASTSWTSGESGTITATTSASRTASAIDTAARPPAATSGAIFSGDRL